MSNSRVPLRLAIIGNHRDANLASELLLSTSRLVEVDPPLRTRLDLKSLKRLLDLARGDVDVLLALGKPSRRMGAAARVLGLPVGNLSLAQAQCNWQLCLQVLAEAAARPGAGLKGGPEISVVTTVLNDREDLHALLGVLVSQLEDDDEIIVVDGGSTDGTAELAATWGARDSRVRPVAAVGTNISAGRNRGIALARHDIIACTDAGCVPDEDWLPALRRAFKEPESPDLVTGLYRASTRGPLEEAMAISLYPSPNDLRRPNIVVRTYSRIFGRAFRATEPTGRSVAFTRSVWTSARGFDEDLATGEDVSFGHEVALVGGKCTVTRDASVLWWQRETLGATISMYRRYGVGQALSGHLGLLARDLLRLAAYLMIPFALSKGGRLRTCYLLGASSYVSVPVVRGLRARVGLRTLVGVPLVMALKDLAKAAGCVEGILLATREQPDSA